MGYDVVAFGELLIDFTPYGISEQQNPLYEANPGGAPCNVLAMLAKLGRRVAFIGKVGKDLHGRFLINSIEKCGIDSKWVIMDESRETTLAFVALADDGEREFAFVRKAGADIAFSPEELDCSMFANTNIFHFGSLSLTNEPSRSATVRAAEMARAAGCIISFDPNMRELLWSDMKTAKEQMLWGCNQCSIIKLAMEELFFLTDTNDLKQGVSALKSMFPAITTIFVTDGKAGSHAFYQNEAVHAPAFLTNLTIDTTGAGDTFMGCCLHYLLEQSMKPLSTSQLQEMLNFANAAASLITTRKGALCAMPSKAEIKRL